MFSFRTKYSNFWQKTYRIIIRHWIKLHSFHFLFLGIWSLLVTKLQKYYIIFVWKKTGKKIKQPDWPKHQKPKDENRGWTKQNSITRPKLKAVADFHGVIYPAKILALFMRDLVRGLLVLILQNASVNRKNSHSYFCI